MKMIKAIVRPEKERDVIAALERIGVYPYTRYNVFGRGRQKGIRVGSVRYEELAKVLFMLVVDEVDEPSVVDTLKIAARTGNPGDGKIFISTLADARSIRT